MRLRLASQAESPPPAPQHRGVSFDGLHNLRRQAMDAVASCEEFGVVENHHSLLTVGTYSCRRAAEEPSVETPLVGQDNDDQGPAAAVRKWGRSVSIMLDHGGTVRHCTSHMSPVRTIGLHAHYCCQHPCVIMLHPASVDPADPWAREQVVQS